MPEHDDTIARLERDGLIRREGTSLRTTRRWQGAMARAARHLQELGDSGDDLRVPIAYAVIDLYGNDEPDDAIARCVEVMLPIEARELEPQRAAKP